MKLADIVVDPAITAIGAFTLLSCLGLSFTYARTKAAAASSSKRKFPNGLPFKHSLMSHRGGSREWVENTLPGFRYSGEILKADLLEMDVMLTKDGQVVIFHDDTMERMCGEEFANRRIEEFNFSDLPPLKIPADLQKMPHVTLNQDSVKIPLLTTLLKEFPQYPMQIDVKNGPEELVLKTGNLMKEYKREKFTVWGSFKPAVGDMCYKLFGTDIPLFFTLTRALKAKFLWHLGLMDLMEFRESCIIMPNRWFLMSSGWIKALRAKGISVIIFGASGALNTQELWEEVAAKGVTGICSDYPSLLDVWLIDHPLK